jgi:hypothetical protein
MQRRAILPLSFAILSSALLLAHTARGAEGVSVTITNDSTEDILVTVYDTSTNPKRTVLAGARITGFTSVPVSLTANASGKATLSWSATNVDPEFPKCGHADAAVDDADSVSVHADSECAT